MNMTRGVGGSTAANELAELKPWALPAPPIGKAERLRRLEKAQHLMATISADALIVGAGPTLRYFTGVTWGATDRLVAAVIPARGDPVMICPGFEIGSLKASLAIDASIHLWEEDESPFRLLARLLATWGASVLAFDPALSFRVFNGLRKESASCAIVDASSIIDECRMIKTESELALMQQAKRMTLDVQRRAARILYDGIRASAVKRFIDAAHRALGAESGSSFCAVQFGEATAFPHGVPGDQILHEGDVVLIDTGCQVDGYNSDITRTYVFGEATPEIARIWIIEKEAQDAAFAIVRPGITCQDVDIAARGCIERAGLGPGYQLPGLPHRTGHGIGLSIHEPPYLVRGDLTPLRTGMCFSNEPMIVVPGAFGIRLEDHFHVTDQGASWFTPPQPSLEAPFG
jgi:Xaa-Pro dipeptidase